MIKIITIMSAEACREEKKAYLSSTVLLDGQYTLKVKPLLGKEPYGQ